MYLDFSTYLKLVNHVRTLTRQKYVIFYFFFPFIFHGKQHLFLKGFLVLFFVSFRRNLY